jgi:hypothetical protein
MVQKGEGFHAWRASLSGWGSERQKRAFLDWGWVQRSPRVRFLFLTGKAESTLLLLLVRARIAPITHRNSSTAISLAPAKIFPDVRAVGH